MAWAEPFHQRVGEHLGCVDGLYEWSTDKPAMHAFVRDYFAERREDG